MTAKPIFTGVDCLSVPIPDLEAALEFYRDKLGLEPVWKHKNEAAGLRMGGSETEFVLRRGKEPPETDVKVDSAREAAKRFAEAGGSIVGGPFEIKIGFCVVVEDPWGNVLVLLDSTKGLLKTDSNGNVID